MSAHPDIVTFMALYEHIQTVTKGSPDRVTFLYGNDAKFAEACRKISDLAFWLDFRVKDAGDAVIENVDQTFITRWRHYQLNLASRIDPLVSQDFLKELGLINTNEAAKSDVSPSLVQDSSSRTTETNAKNQAQFGPDAALKEEVLDDYDAIQTRLEFGSYDRLSPELDEEIAQKVYDGERALQRLLNGIGLKLPNALYRQRKLRAVHIPTHVSSKYGNAEISLAHAIREAQRAFIVGAPLAALALCRTVSEVIIRDHYKIGDPKSKLLTPLFVAAEGDSAAKTQGADRELLELVKYSSEILHGRWDKKTLSDEVGVDVLQSDLNIINRFVLRWLDKLVGLIEGTPKY